jgi:hypothetical protein
VEVPARLYIFQRAKFIDAVIAKQVVCELLDPGTIGRVGLGLGQTLAQEAGSFSEVLGSRRFSNWLTSFVVLDPEKGTAGPGVDRSLSSMTSLLKFHGIFSFWWWVELLGLV